MRIADVTPYDNLTQQYSDMIANCDTLQSLKENLYEWRELTPDAYNDVARNFNQEYMKPIIRLVNLYRIFGDIIFKKIPELNSQTPNMKRFTAVLMPPQLLTIAIVAANMNTSQGQALHWCLTNKILIIDRTGAYKALKCVVGPDELVAMYHETLARI